MYYPLSQITTNLYTNGGEYVLLNSKQPYTGYYWKTAQEKIFTGKTPQDTPIEELILITNETLNLVNVSNASNVVSYYNKFDDDSINYLNLTKQPLPPLPPYYSLNFPTQQDYQIGEFKRLFCKKINELIYLEINKEVYDKLIQNDSTIAFQYYQAFNIPWQLTGNKEQVYTTNKNIVELTMKQQKLSQFDKYLKEDYIKYYK